MVTDTLLIGRVADLSVYVCRADYTRKAEYILINELSNNKNYQIFVQSLMVWIFKRKNMAIIMGMESIVNTTAMVNVMAMVTVMEKIK